MIHSVFFDDPTHENPSWPLNFSRDNSTVVNEAGHYFHLYHTFQGDDTDSEMELRQTFNFNERITT
jgi:hypothetical protein